MSLLGILIVLTGLLLMAFGLFVFYAWLPFFYAILGFDIGAMLGRWITGDVGLLSITLGIVGAVILCLGSYYLEPFRRILLGISAGVLIGLTLADVFGFDGRMGATAGAILALLFGFIGGSVVPRHFDMFVVCATAIAGAGLVMSGLHLIMPNVAAFDATSGGTLPYLLGLVLAAGGIVWQSSNIEKWLRSRGLLVERVN